jgi:predicted glutamine amidotransferase
MASVNKVKDRGVERHKLTDTSFGRRAQYFVNLEKHSAKQWISAHNGVMQSLTPSQRKTLPSGQIKKLAAAWLDSPKEARIQAKASGLTVEREAALSEDVEAAARKYLDDYCKPRMNSATAISKAKRQCLLVLAFLQIQSDRNLVC